MNTAKACKECVVRKLTRFANNNMPEDMRDEYIKEASEAILKVQYRELETAWESVARRYLKTDDIHREEKEKFQKCVLDMMEDLEKLLEGSEDTIDDAIKFAIVGNIIDFATMPNLTVDMVKEMLNKVKKIEFDKELYNFFRKELEEAKEIVLLLDNVGEVVFDSILCKKIKEVYPDKHIVAVPSGYPISSDTTSKECYESGMADYADIIPNGNDIVGTYIPKCSKECVDAIENADIIISKGMANFEVLGGSDYNVYYFFLCKCEFYCKALNANMLQEMFISDKHSNTKEIMKEVWKELGKTNE